MNTNDRARKLFTTFLPEPQAVSGITPEVGRLVDALNGEMSRSELMTALGLKDKKHFRTQYQQATIAWASSR